MLKDLFKKKEEVATEAVRVVKKEPQRLAQIVEMEEPLDIFPEEQS